MVGITAFVIALAVVITLLFVGHSFGNNPPTDAVQSLSLILISPIEQGVVSELNTLYIQMAD
ncbi:MAG: hypothetical protein ACK5I7_06310 [Anaerotignum sp.]